MSRGRERGRFVLVAAALVATALGAACGTLVSSGDDGPITTLPDGSTDAASDSTPTDSGALDAFAHEPGSCTDGGVFCQDFEIDPSPWGFEDVLFDPPNSSLAVTTNLPASGLRSLEARLAPNAPFAVARKTIAIPPTASKLVVRFALNDVTAVSGFMTYGGIAYALNRQAVLTSVGVVVYDPVGATDSANNATPFTRQVWVRVEASLTLADGNLEIRHDGALQISKTFPALAKKADDASIVVSFGANTNQSATSTVIVDVDDVVVSWE
jgi:hypothetical protein